MAIGAQRVRPPRLRGGTRSDPSPYPRSSLRPAVPVSLGKPKLRFNIEHATYATNDVFVGQVSFALR